MSTLKGLVDEIIFEAKKDTLKVFYNIDVFLQDFKDDEEEVADEPVTPVIPPVDPNVPADPNVPVQAESNTKHGNQLNEAIIKTKVKGELTVTKEEASNIQTLQDLIDFLSDKKHTQQTIVEKVLDKKGSTIGETIISPEIQEVILVLAGTGDTTKLADIVDKGDKVLVDIDYGSSRETNIGLKINKNSGTDSFSIMLKKDGKILSGAFDQSMLNKQILFYRNSLES